jgi:hypothetical protein
MTHALTCPVSGCTGHRRNSSMLMCWPCWRRVPKLLQNAVWDAFRNFERKGSLESITELRAAQGNAIKAVEAKNAEAGA